MVGEAIVVCFLALGIKRAAISFWRGRDLLSAWPLFALLYVTFSNFAEVSLTMLNSVDWIVCVAAFLFATNGSRRVGELDRSTQLGPGALTPPRTATAR